MSGNIKLITPDKKPVSDAAFTADYENAKEIGKVRIGSLAIYYKDGLKKYCVPFDYIDRAFTRISGCNARTCCTINSFDYYRLVLVHDDKEFANIIFGDDEAPVDEAESLLKECRPEIEIGYVKPEK